MVVSLNRLLPIRAIGLALILLVDLIRQLLQYVVS